MRVTVSEAGRVKVSEGEGQLVRMRLTVSEGVQGEHGRPRLSEGEGM